MSLPKRLKRQEGRYGLVDGIPFDLPVASKDSPALMAAYSIDYEKARKLMPGREVHPFRIWNKAVLLITVIDYRVTTIGKYVEFSIGIGCTQGRKPAPPLLPLIFMKSFGTGQYVFDLPVSSEVSVKGGKGIWGMPKHQANLNFLIGEKTVSSQYDLDGRFAMKIEVQRSKKENFPVNMSGANYCAFRGMLMKSYVYFKGKAGFCLFKKGSAKLTIGDHPRLKPLKDLDISENPLFSGFFPKTDGVLDDHFENWFLDSAELPTQIPEGLESVVHLTQSQEWLEPPKPLD